MQTSMKVTIYHNPRCSKSRQTLALLEEHDIDIEIIEYFKTPLDQKKLKNIIKLLNIPAADLLRKKESTFEESGIANKLDDEEAVIQAMIDNPVLIERPIVIANNKAAIGRPPENVLDILK